MATQSAHSARSRLSLPRNQREERLGAGIHISELIRERRPRSWARRAPLVALLGLHLKRTSVCALIGAALLVLSVPVGSKTTEAPTHELSGPLRSTVLRAQAAVGVDSARLLALFRGLQQSVQSESVERRLAEIIGSELSTLGFQVELSAEAGEVVGILRNGRGPTLVYRADTGADLSLRVWMDPTPASAYSAAETLRCGPDAHVTWMLGMAKALVALRSEWAGTLVLIGQATRLGPSPQRAAPANASSLRVPIPDFLVALRASAEPVGSVLSVQGVRRPGSDQVEVTYERVGAYARSGSTPQLGTASARAYELPVNVQFSYLLVGVAEPSLDENDAASEADRDGAVPDEAPPDVLAPLHLELSAIPLGTKLATVAVLELLAKRPPARAPRPQASGPLDLNLHRY